jgi:hypothetical protein
MVTERPNVHMPSRLRGCSRAPVWLQRSFTLFFLAVLAYTFVEVCDFDGSKTLSMTASMEAATVVADVPLEIECGASSDSVVAWSDDPLLVGAEPHVWKKPETMVALSPIESAREHHYRTGLPRDSVQDSFPSA